MAKYKPYSYAQGQFIPVFFDKQIQPGTFEFTLNYLIDNELRSTGDMICNNYKTLYPVAGACVAL